MQVPPYISGSFSTNSTSSPWLAKLPAKVFPALPKPIIIFLKCRIWTQSFPKYLAQLNLTSEAVWRLWNWLAFEVYSSNKRLLWLINQVISLMLNSNWFAMIFRRLTCLRKVEPCEGSNAIIFVICTGTHWCQLPHDFPKQQTIYNYFTMCPRPLADIEYSLIWSNIYSSDIASNHRWC